VAIALALGFPEPMYVHVPMVVGDSGERLAKRDGAITLPELAGCGLDIDRIRTALAVSIGVAEPGETVSAIELVGRFDLRQFASRPSAPMNLKNLLHCG